VTFLFPFSVNRNVFLFVEAHKLESSLNKFAFFEVFGVGYMPLVAFKVYQLRVNHGVFNTAVT